MKKYFITAFILAILVSIYASFFPFGKSKQAWQPDWYDTQDDSEFIYFYGVAERASQNLAGTAAEAHAYAEVAKYVEACVQPERESQEDETVTNIAINIQIPGSHIINRHTSVTKDSKYKSFVQLAVPKETLEKEIEKRKATKEQH